MVAARRTIEPVPAFAQLFGNIRNGLPGATADAVARLREERFKRFQSIGFPTAKAEAWKYTNVGKLANQAMEMAPQVDVGLEPLSALFLGGPRARRLIFVNGHLVPQLCHVKGLPPGVVIRSLNRAIEETPDEVAAVVGDLEDERSFTDLNAAFMRSGAWIEVADGASFEEPLQLLFVTVGQAGAVMTHPRCVVRLGNGSRFKLIESHVAIGEGHCLTNLVGQISLGEGAELQHDRLQIFGDGTSYIGRFDITLERNSKLKQTVATMGGGLVRNENEMRIDGSGVEGLLNGVYMPRGREHVDTLIRIHHRKGGSHSDQFYKGVVDDHSHAVFAGKIFVHEDAQQTNAFQKNDNLLRSDDAEVDTKPELEIYADDVKCSHGATVGDLDERGLFYLRSRGLDRDTAASILTYAFAAEVFERFSDETVRRAAHKAACARLPGGSALLDML